MNAPATTKITNDAGGSRDSARTLRGGSTRAGLPAQVRARPMSPTELPRSDATPLPQPLRAQLGTRFGQDFAAVRLHRGAQAEASADALAARAYAVGDDIVLGASAPPLDTHEGRKLIAHETAHVVQQRRGGPPPAMTSEASHEQSAERAAAAFANGAQTVDAGAGTAVGVARDEDPKKKPKPIPGVDPDIDADVERSIVEEKEDQPGPTAPKPATRPSNKAAKDARKEAGKTRDKNAAALGVGDGGQVHHSIEVQVLKRYPGVFTQEEINDPDAMRGIKPENDNKRQLHNSKIREVWDRSYVELDGLIKKNGLKKGTPEYKAFVRKYLTDARDTMDHTLGNLYSEAWKEETGQVAQATGVKKKKGSASASPTGTSATPAGGTSAKPKAKAKPKPTAKAKPAATAKPAAKAKPALKPKAPAKAKPAASVASAPGVAKPKGATKAAATTADKTDSPSAPAAATAKPSPAAKSKGSAAAGKIPSGASGGKAALPKASSASGTAKSRPALPKGSDSKGGSVPAKASVRSALPSGAGRMASKPAFGGGRMPRGSGRAMAGAAGSALLAAVAVPIINHYLQKEYSEWVREGAEETLSNAIEARRGEYEAAIEARRGEIEAAQKEGKRVRLHVVVDTNWQDTTDPETGINVAGSVMTRADVARFEILHENEKPRAYTRELNGGWLGDLVRGGVGTDLTFQEFDIVLEGTDEERRGQKERMAKVDALAGNPPQPFEALILTALRGEISPDLLREYVAIKRDEMKALKGVVQLEALDLYWARMDALLDGSLEQIITQAKEREIWLDPLRKHAVEKRDMYGGSGDAGAGAHGYAYWSEVIRLIDGT